MNAKQQFAAREVVRLAAGGPAMTVEGPGEFKGHVWCTWSNGKFHHGGSFDEGVLIRVDPPVDESRSRRSSRHFQTPVVER
jgi:uncharacterized protein YodC (DUF2158 family)